ncbi:hypothetical protein FM037_17280 [Shewanella psychropiezotolerans]|uniref:Uncharacterized protein n=1 Tax=Shewanella psychropiezotolerans TaxID=2593655 RepID=A0ABX5X1P1_9GAMM|nr:hypothetical protein [Shewanella psychropiezotolerans]QDO84647.1 hypothetical protein FM037_17280 [Shewanella psychropiezotolerans]
MNDVAIEEKQNFLKKLFSGGFRLVDVFWAGFILVGAIIGLCVSKLATFESIIIGDCLKSVYFILISVAVWKSASLYQGKKVWLILAKISAVLTITASIFELGAWAIYLSSN